MHQDLVEAGAAGGMEAILIKMGASKSHVRFALDRARILKRPLPEVIRDVGLVSAEMVARAIAQMNSLPYFAPMEVEALDVAELARYAGLMEELQPFAPIGTNDRGGVLVAAASMQDVNRARNHFHEHRPTLCIASESTIQAVYRRYYARTLEALDTTVAALERAIEAGTETDNPGLVQEVVCCMLRYACYQGASDVFLSRSALGGIFKMKKDGTGEVVRSLPDAVFERVMTMLAGSSGATERLAQGPVDTRVTIDSPDVQAKFGDILHRYNFRMALTPAMKKRILAVIRIQDAHAQEVEFDSIGFDTRSNEILRGWIRRPAGLILVTGPTGSGKTTSLYSMLQMIDPLAKQIASVENPVEAEFSMWAQQEVVVKGDADEGDLFHKQLVSLLRQAPDVILLGEMRDSKVVAAVLAAANTGHLVFTTLHTKSAAGAILRLREMDASVDALAYTLIGVLAQRLVPTLCPHCKTPDSRDEVARELDQAWLEGLTKAPMRRTDGGCQRCGGTGIRGRRMVYEIMEGDKIRPLVEANAPISKIHDAGIQPGQSMWARSLLLVAAGLVDMDELRDRVERS
ncbi:MAG: ATPase, T2SS/T4P/T4SS family [Gallionellaceae bacterium]|nr:ATPase, T2SS/T4P/T4SS family [Gallionellaceae bacterium]